MKKYNKTNRVYIDLDKSKQNAVKYYIQHELDFYNKINNVFSTYFKKSPKSFNQLFKKLKLVGDVVEHKISVKEEIKNPDKLADVKDDLTFLSPETLDLLEDLRLDTPISPRMKRNMAVEMFKYYASQAGVINNDGSLKYPARLLESQDIVKKRHIQLHRKTLIVEYDKDNEQTLIRIPYLKDRLVLDGNFKNMKWNILVVRQKPNVPVTQETSWCLDFKNAEQDYMLKFLDNPNPRTSFAAVAKDYKRSRF